LQHLKSKTYSDFKNRGQHCGISSSEKVHFRPRNLHQQNVSENILYFYKCRTVHTVHLFVRLITRDIWRS